MRAILKISLTVLLTFVLLPEVQGQGGWTIQNSGTTSNLNYVYFLNKYTGYTVGSNGKILKTTNKGNNWSSKLSGTTKNLRSIYFITIGKGFCAGDSGTYLYTQDSGRTWQDISFSIPNNLYSVHYTDAYNGFISGDSLILATFDGGQNWEYINLLNSLLAICFPGAANGYAIDHQGGIYKSADGGHNWRRYTIPFNILPTSIYFTGVSTGYITGASPYNIIKTSDGGTNWIVTHSGASSLNSVFFTSATMGFAGGDNGTILRTTNEGVLWYPQNTTTSEGINSIYFSDSLNGAAVGNNGLILTTMTSGEIPTYKIISGNVRYADNDNLVDNGWVKAIKYDTTTSRIITIDSAVINSNGEYAVKVPIGDSTDIMAYQDDETADYVPTYYPSSIEWTESVTLYPTQDRSNVNIKVFRMETTTPQGYISGYVFKTVLRPTDSELPGSIIYAKTGNTFKGFAISDSIGKYKVNLPIGNYKLYVKRYGYTNDSISVNIEAPTLTHDSINFYLQKLTSGIIPLEEVYEIYYHLEQNYPNPFNPSTSIEYVLGTTAFVKLTIYDITGKEIAVLENSEKFPGSYKVDFHSGNLPSGIYFYKLETDKYVSSRSMILLK